MVSIIGTDPPPPYHQRAFPLPCLRIDGRGGNNCGMKQRIPPAKGYLFNIFTSTIDEHRPSPWIFSFLPASSHALALPGSSGDKGNTFRFVLTTRARESVSNPQTLYPDPKKTHARASEHARLTHAPSISCANTKRPPRHLRNTTFLPARSNPPFPPPNKKIYIINVFFFSSTRALPVSARLRNAKTQKDACPCERLHLTT